MASFTESEIGEIELEQISIKDKQPKTGIVITSSISLIGAGQDRVRTGSAWIIVQDGHGGNACIHYLDTLDYAAIMQMENPAEEIHRLVQPNISGQEFIKSGSTLCIARVIPELSCIEIINAGDSQAEVYIDGNKVFCSQPHTYTDAKSNDPEEFARLATVVSRTMPGQTLKVHTPEIITYTESRISVFKCGRLLVPTQALGHNNMTGFTPTKTRIPYLPGQKVRVCVYSDGVSDMKVDSVKECQDMVGLSVQQLVDKYEARWRQSWLFAANSSDLSKTQKTDMGDNFDDLCMGIIDIL